MHSTTASYKNAKQSVVISNASDTDTLPSDDGSVFFMDDDSDGNDPKNTDTTTTKKTGTAPSGFLDIPPSSGAPSTDRPVEPTAKVEVQIQRKPFIPVSPFTPNSPTPFKMEVEIAQIFCKSKVLWLRDACHKLTAPTPTKPQGERFLMRLA